MTKLVFEVPGSEEPGYLRRQRQALEFAQGLDIENPNPEMLDKMVEFRSAHPGVEIGIDGGIKEGNIVQVAQAGADVIYVGSAIFLQPQPGESFHRLQSLVEEGSQHRGY